MRQFIYDKLNENNTREPNFLTPSLRFATSNYLFVISRLSILAGLIFLINLNLDCSILNHDKNARRLYRFVEHLNSATTISPSFNDLIRFVGHGQVSESVRASLSYENGKNYLNLLSSKPNWVGNFGMGSFDSLSTNIDFAFRFREPQASQEQSFGALFVSSEDNQVVGGIRFQHKGSSRNIDFSVIIRDMSENPVNGVNFDRVLNSTKIPATSGAWQEVGIRIGPGDAFIKINSNEFQMLFDHPAFQKKHRIFLSFFVVETSVQIDFRDVKQGSTPVDISSTLEDLLLVSDFTQINRYYQNEDIHYSPPASYYVYKLPIGKDYRNAIAGYAPFILEFPLENLTTNCFLRTGFGILDQSWGNNISVRFQVQLSNSKNVLTVFDETIIPDKTIKGNRWIDRTVDLEKYHDVFSRIKFIAETVGKAHAPTFVAWSNPVLMPKDAENNKPNVLLISLDTVRPDRLSCFGYNRQTTPNIDAIAREGVIFTQCISQASWTTPSHFSILTSQYPSVHGVIQPMAERYKRLSPQKVTLAEFLRRQEYMTAAFVANSPVMSGNLGFYNGFGRYVQNGLLGDPHDIEEVTESAVKWLERIAFRYPFFLFLHTFETHLPFTNTFYAGDSVDYRNKTQAEAHLSDLYDGDLHFTDMHLAKVFDCLKRLGLLDNTIVIITSDHGYIMPGEHGNYRGYANNLYEGTVRVPLIMRFPKVIPENKKIAPQVRSIDIAPTILDLLGFDSFPDFQGISLFPLIQGKPMEPIVAYAEALNNGPERKMMRTEHYKYIYIPEMIPEKIKELTGEGLPVTQRELFNLRDDPVEAINLADEKRMQLTEYQKLIDNFMIASEQNKTGVANTINLDDETVKNLKAMGYIK